MIGKGDHCIGSINVLTVQEPLLELYRIVMKWSKTALQSAPPVQDMEMGKTAKPQKNCSRGFLCAHPGTAVPYLSAVKTKGLSGEFVRAHMNHHILILIDSLVW